MFQNQLINAVVSWEWHLQMAEEIQKNLQGKPREVPAEAAQQRARVPFWKAIFSRKPSQPEYVGCASEQCGKVGVS